MKSYEFSAPTLSGSINFGRGDARQNEIAMLDSSGALRTYDQQRRLKKIANQGPIGVDHIAHYRYDSRSRRRAEVLLDAPTAIANQYTWHQADFKARLTESKTVAGPIALVQVINTQSDHNASLSGEIQPGVAAATPVDYGYNSADARALYSDSTGSLAVSSDEDHRLTKTEILPGHVTVDMFSYEANGTRSADGTRDYTIDGLGRIVRIDDKNSAQFLEISYDALGRPCKLNDGNVREFSYFGSELVQETLNGNLDRQYSNHPMLGKIATHVSGESFQHLYDARQNEIVTLDSATAVREIHRYSDFGVPSTTFVGAATGLDPTFGGMRYLNISGTPAGAPPIAGWPQGLYLGMYRLYDPYNGVWLSNDPLGYVDGPNRSAYVGQNPIGFIDPLGLDKRGKKQESNFASAFLAATGGASLFRDDPEPVDPNTRSNTRELSGVQDATKTVYGSLAYIQNHAQLRRPENDGLDLTPLPGLTATVGRNLSVTERVRRSYINTVESNPYGGLEAAKEYRKKVREQYRPITPQPERAFLDRNRPLSEESAKVRDPLKAKKTNARVNEQVKLFGKIGKLTTGVALGMSAYDILTAKDPARETVGEAFSWSGAYSFGVFGAEIGAIGGPWGSLALGLGFSAFGGILGERVGQAAYDLAKSDLPLNVKLRLLGIPLP